MKTKKIISILIPIIVLGIGCQKRFIRGVSSFRARSASTWGVDSRRTGYSGMEVNPPFRLAWTYKASGAVGKAIVAVDSFLVFGTKAGEIHVLMMKTGKSLKNLKVEKKVEVTCLAVEDRLIACQRWQQPSIRCFSFSTGKIVWEEHLGPIVGEPLLDDGHIIGGTERGEIFSMDSQSGSVDWKTSLGKPVVGSVAKSGDIVVCATEGGKVCALSSRSGSLEWQRRISGSFTATPVLSDGRVFIGTTEGHFYGLAMEDGSINWDRILEGGVYLTAAVAKGFVFIGTTQGLLYCLDANDGSECWRFETGSVVGTSPVISGRCVYFGSLDRTLYALDRFTGEEAWQFKAKGRIRTSPLIWNNTLIIASEDRYVYGFVEDK